jgi:putative membrane protein
MRRLSLIIPLILIACLLQACKGTKKSNDAAGDDTTDITADTSKHGSIIVDRNDIKFVTDVAAACMAEIEVGNLAKQKGSDKRVKNFGAMMIKDLSKGKAKLIALAKAKKITLPDSISTTDRQEIDDLAKKSGKDFDSSYLDKTKTDHKRALELFKSAAKHAYDPDIKGFANKNLMSLHITHRNRPIGLWNVRKNIPCTIFK